VGFFYNGFDNPHLVAQSPSITCKDVNMPLHGRVTLTGVNTEAVVQWTTHDSAGGQVQIGARSGRYTDTFDASDMRYNRTDMCGGTAEHVRSLRKGVVNDVAHAVSAPQDLACVLCHCAALLLLNVRATPMLRLAHAIR
jgi:hypothetical protein